MINRIVRMSFEPEQVHTFMEVFNRSKAQIAAFPGCSGLKLLQDADHANVYYTYSLWIDDESLQQYRASALFQTTWAQTKVLFNAKPMAFSTLIADHVK